VCEATCPCSLGWLPCGCMLHSFIHQAPPHACGVHVCLCVCVRTCVCTRQIMASTKLARSLSLAELALMQNQYYRQHACYRCVRHVYVCMCIC
jgi:hypothetical protein